MNNENLEDGDVPVADRWPELLTALFLAGLALLVIVDSLRVGAGWADDGPRAGYFPFYIGLALLASSLWIGGGALLRWRRVKTFASREQFRRVLTVLWPMAVFVVLVRLLGIYVGSALLIGWFMSRHGRHGVVSRLAVSLGVPLVFFLVFERWFLVPLPKGPLEAALGF